MSPRNNSFKRQKPKTQRRKGNPRSKGRRRTSKSIRSNPLKQVLRSVYQVISALPILPAPVKSAADWVARQFGLTSASATPAFVMTDGAINALEWAGFLRTDLFVTGCPQAGAYSEHNIALSTNIKTVCPKTINFAIKPQNPVSARRGYYTFGFMPSTGPESYSYFNSLDKEQLGYERFLSRVPLKMRFEAAQGGSCSYTVPKSNSYLHNGIPLRATGDQGTEDVVGFLVIVYKCDARIDYKDFTADEVAFDFRITTTSVPGQIDPLTTQSLYGGRIVKDFNEAKSRYVFKNSKTLESFQVNTPTWDINKKAFTAKASDLVKLSVVAEKTAIADELAAMQM